MNATSNRHCQRFSLRRAQRQAWLRVLTPTAGESLLRKPDCTHIAHVAAARGLMQLGVAALVPQFCGSWTARS
jgi:hypothetical protein